MSNAFFVVPKPINEPVKAYAPGTAERDALIAEYNLLANQAPIDIPMYIGNEKVTTDKKVPMSPPHDHKKVLGHFNYGDKSHVEKAINAA